MLIGVFSVHVWAMLKTIRQKACIQGGFPAKCARSWAHTLNNMFVSMSVTKPHTVDPIITQLLFISSAHKSVILHTTDVLTWKKLKQYEQPRAKRDRRHC